MHGTTITWTFQHYLTLHGKELETEDTVQVLISMGMQIFFHCYSSDLLSFHSAASFFKPKSCFHSTQVLQAQLQHTSAPTSYKLKSCLPTKILA
jgi:hypothetical protein